VKPVSVHGKTKPPRTSSEPVAPHYQLRLFVTGTTPRSARAIQNIRAICEAYLPGRYDLEVIDIYQHPEHVKAEQIVVTPTLVRQLPHPVRKLIGDLSDTERVLAGLDIAPRPISARPPGTEHAA
jgi:circadian clock protein KaiB